MIAAFPTTAFVDPNNTPMLTGDNYAEWKDVILLTLGSWTYTWHSVRMLHRALWTKVMPLRGLIISGGSDLIA